MVPAEIGSHRCHIGLRGSDHYGVVFGTCKSAVDRMARDMAVELKGHNVASVSMWLGLTFTSERAERNLKNPAMTSQTVTNPSAGSSVEFPGRVIVALAKDPQIMKRTGGTYIAAELAQEYGVTDVDGKVPPSLRAQRGYGHRFELFQRPLLAPLREQHEHD